MMMMMMVVVVKTAASQAYITHCRQTRRELKYEKIVKQKNNLVGLF